MNHFTDRQLKLAEFFVRTKDFWKKLSVFVIFFATVVIIFGLALRIVVFSSSTINYIFVENELLFNYIPFNKLRPQFQPRSLSVDSIDVMITNGNTGDVVAFVENPNTKWLASEVRVRFSIDGKPADEMKLFILPDSETPVFLFNQRLASSRPRVRLDIMDVSWRRVRDRTPLDVLEGLRVQDIEIVQNPQTGSMKAAGTLVNQSSSGLWTVGLAVIANRQAVPVGVHYTTIVQLASGSARSIAVAWPYSITGVDSVDMIPLVNVFDESVYMPFLGTRTNSDPSGRE